MENIPKKSTIRLFIREICKSKTEEELKEAEENFKEYLLVVKEICDRIEDQDEEPSIDVNEPVE